MSLPVAGQLVSILVFQLAVCVPPIPFFFLKDGKDLGKLGTDYMWQVNEFAAKHGLLSK